MKECKKQTQMKHTSPILKRMRKGYIVWPLLGSDDMTDTGPAICPVKIHKYNKDPDLHYEVACPDGSFVGFCQSNDILTNYVCRTKEAAFWIWEEHAQKFLAKHQTIFNTSTKKVLKDLKNTR
jgi:hypothetical protein